MKEENYYSKSPRWPLLLSKCRAGNQITCMSSFLLYILLNIPNPSAMSFSDNQKQTCVCQRYPFATLSYKNISKSLWPYSKRPAPRWYNVTSFSPFADRKGRLWISLWSWKIGQPAINRIGLSSRVRFFKVHLFFPSPSYPHPFYFSQKSIHCKVGESRPVSTDPWSTRPHSDSQFYIYSALLDLSCLRPRWSSLTLPGLFS